MESFKTFLIYKLIENCDLNALRRFRFCTIHRKSLLRRVCMVTHIARVRINRVRLPTLHVVSETGRINISLSPFAPENLISRDRFGSSPVPRQPAHLYNQTESGAYLRNSSRVPQRRPFLYLNRHTPSGQCRVPMAFIAESPSAQGQYTSR